MTVRVHRIDQGTSAGKPVKLANGWLRVDALLTRTGVRLGWHEVVEDVAE